jgi:hypothetical protein
MAGHLELIRLPLGFETLVNFEEVLATWRNRDPHLRQIRLAYTGDATSSELYLQYTLGVSSAGRVKAPILSEHNVSIAAIEMLIATEAQTRIASVLNELLLQIRDDTDPDATKFELAPDSTILLRPEYLSRRLDISVADDEARESFVYFEVEEISFKSPLRLRSQLAVVAGVLISLNTIATNLEGIENAFGKVAHCGITHTLECSSVDFYQNEIRAAVMKELEYGSKTHNYKPLQAYLKQFTYYSGKVDGIPGPLTHKAVREFAKAAGLPEDISLHSEALWTAISDVEAKNAKLPSNIIRREKERTDAALRTLVRDFGEEQLKAEANKTR